MNKITFNQNYRKTTRKLTNQEATLIRKKYHEGAVQSNLAKEFNVNQTTISQIVRGVTYRQGTSKLDVQILADHGEQLRKVKSSNTFLEKRVDKLEKKISILERKMEKIENQNQKLDEYVRTLEDKLNTKG